MGQSLRQKHYQGLAQSVSQGPGKPGDVWVACVKDTLQRLRHCEIMAHVNDASFAFSLSRLFRLPKAPRHHFDHMECKMGYVRP